jgi:hypothetical protein
MTQKTKSINLFATREDWSSLLASVEDQLAVAYVLGGSCATPPSRIESYNHLEDLGEAGSGNASNGQIYLCLANDAEIQTRSVEQRKGGHTKFVDQQSNPDTVVLKPGGRFEGNIIIAGQIGTVSETEWSLRAFSVFQKEVRKQFKKVKSYYVGRDARRLFDEGCRLTANARSPEEYDLSLE